MTFDDDDLPAQPESWWSNALPVLAMRYKQRVAAHTASRRDRRSRPSRAKPAGRVRLYAGVPVVVRRAIRAHVAELRRMRKAGR